MDRRGSTRLYGDANDGWDKGLEVEEHHYHHRCVAKEKMVPTNHHYPPQQHSRQPPRMQDFVSWNLRADSSRSIHVVDLHSDCVAVHSVEW